MLRGGDCLVADDGRIVRIVAAAEALMEVRCADPGALARAAYHLGNRHCPVAIGAGWLRFAADHVLAEMLLGMGLATLRGLRAVRARGRRLRGGPSAPFERSEALPASSTTSRIAKDRRSDEATALDAPLALVRLLQLASPTLPIGAYSYSQGLEWAVAAGAVGDRRGECATGSAVPWSSSSRPARPPSRGGSLNAAQRRRLAGSGRMERLVPRVARDRGAARRDRADGRVAAQGLHPIWSCSMRRRARQPTRCLPSRFRQRMRSSRAASASRGGGADGIRLVVAGESGTRRDQDDPARTGGRAAPARRPRGADSCGSRARPVDR